jgi:hypothetical protein
MATTQTQDTSTLLGRRWHDMSGGEKVKFLVKLIIALCTFGFAYPNVMTE